MDTATLREFTARFATAEEIDNWDKHVTANPNGGNMLQSDAYAAVKDGNGWLVRRLVIETQEYSSYNLLLEKKFPVLGRLWYLIKGPDVAAVEDIQPLLKAVATLAKKQKMNVFTIKIEPDVVESPEVTAQLKAAGLVKAPNIQSNDSTAILDISAPANEVLRSISSRARNAVRRAEREGCEVVQGEPGEDSYRKLYALMRNTMDAKGAMPLRSYEYYAKFWEEFCSRGQGHFFFVHEDGAPSVGAFVINYGSKATYKDGGSTQNRKQYGDSHLAQWAAIQRMQELGCVEYDFCGTPPAAHIKDKSHPLYGLGSFKTSFTKTVTDFVGCYDLVLGPVRHKLWVKGAERIFRRLETTRTGGQFY
ncbi:peptidoglycan bridge formation glycyltransferase FemA/FemB family protein [Arthrobacter sp. StoSoilB20]|uniref:lipid II:glycine glycyltransferase FemX n=1 Tax=Arthrobacter sp. StoSoilB20 TaxID=2830995 RepID=UPI001CC3B9CC|nr:peptidoglycan bridge formation glycyltransferase FemA/FemB family protein [Arthrobacter sp. StoSoilB20]